MKKEKREAWSRKSAIGGSSQKAGDREPRNTCTSGSASSAASKRMVRAAGQALTVDVAARIAAACARQTTLENCGPLMNPKFKN